MRPLIGTESDMASATERRGEGRVDARQVTVIGNHEHGPSPRLRTGGRGSSQELRPIVLVVGRRAGQHRGGRRATPREVVQKSRSGGIPLPGCSGHRRYRVSGLIHQLGQGSLGRSVPGRNGQAHNIADRARQLSGQDLGGRQDVLGQHGFGADNRPDGAQSPAVLGLGNALDQQARHIATSEAHPHAHPRNSRVG